MRVFNTIMGALLLLSFSFMGLVFIKIESANFGLDFTYNLLGFLLLVGVGWLLRDATGQ